VQHSLSQWIQFGILIPIELGDEHLEIGKVGIELLLSLLESCQFGPGSGCWVQVTKCIVEYLNDDISIIQVDLITFFEGKDLYLSPSLQPVEGVGHPNGGGRESSGVTEQLEMQLSNKPLKGFMVANVNGVVRNLITLTMVWCEVARGELVCDSSGRSKLLLQVVDTPGRVCSRSIKNFHDQYFDIGES